ncbi:MAG: hypothetical protein U0S12_14915 [Fimbriimonadales bacterium]
MATSTAGKESEPKTAQGWLAKARETWRRYRGEEDFRFIAILFAGTSAVLLIRTVLTTGVSLVNTGELPRKLHNWQTFGATVAILAGLLAVSLGVLRDRLWAWWVSLFAWTLFGMYMAGQIWQAANDAKSVMNPGDHVLMVIAVSAWMYAPVWVYQDLKEMRRRKQAEREASRANGSQ